MATDDARADDHEAPWPKGRKQLERPSDEEVRAYDDLMFSRARQRVEREEEDREQARQLGGNGGGDPSADTVPPGFRPPRTEEFCYPVPGPADIYRTVDAVQSHVPPEEVWLYASGGGLRSPQATLGTAWYLDRDDVDHWQYVTRVVSVSGGAMTNAEFAARAKAGATGANAPGRPSAFLQNYHRRLSTSNRWALWLLVAVMAALAIVAFWLVWKSPEQSRWLVERDWFRKLLGVVAYIGGLYGLWLLAGKKLVTFIVLLLAVALVGLGLWFWSTLPALLQLVVAASAIVLVLIVLWLLSGKNAWRWVLVVAAAAAGGYFLWHVLVVLDMRDEWRWLEWIILILLIGAWVLAYLAVLQLGLQEFLQYRLRKILTDPDGTQPSELGQFTSGLAHIFSTADFRMGQPVHVTAGPLEAGATRSSAIAVHDMSEPVNAIHYYDARWMKTRSAVYASVALPGLVLMTRKALPKAAFPDFPGGVVPIPPKPGVIYGSPVYDQPQKKGFVLLDGGLNSTLGARFDPILVGDLDSRGMNRVVDTLYPPANRPTVPNHAVRRVVVDGGQYLGDAGAATTMSTWPGPSAIFSLKRAIDIANLSLLASERQLADRLGAEIWYLPTTGGDQTFDLRFTKLASDALTGLGLPNGLYDVVLQHGLRAWFDSATIPPGFEGLAQSIDRVLLLKQRCDRLSLTAGISEYGYDALASGVASAYVEHRGIDLEPHGLEQCLLDLDQQLLDDDGGVIKNSPLPLVISHQGLRATGVRGNTAQAFLDAVDAGFTMLEVDVMVTGDGHLSALHPGDNNKYPNNPSAAETANQPFAHWQGVFPDLARLRWLLDPTNHAADLFPGDPDAAAKASRLDDAIWNVEAKDRDSADAVADLLTALPAVQDRVIFSGGWLISPLRTFRARHPNIATACHWWEAVKMSFGFKAPTPKLVQPPVVPKNAWWAQPFVIRRLRRAVREARQQGKAILWFQVDHADEAILLRGDVPCHGFMSEGAHVLTWASANYW